LPILVAKITFNTQIVDVLTLLWVRLVAHDANFWKWFTNDVFRLYSGSVRMPSRMSQNTFFRFWYFGKVIHLGPNIVTNIYNPSTRSLHQITNSQILWHFKHLFWFIKQIREFVRTRTPSDPNYNYVLLWT